MNKSIFIEWGVIEINRFTISMYFLIDWMGILFIFTVLLISSMIIFYRREYIIHEINFIRFLYLVLIFIFSILLLILSPNLIRILIGWDGLGLVSYCLVIYYQNYNRFVSGMLTVLINRIGDMFILFRLGIIVILGSWNFCNFNKLKFFILLILIIAFFTKRAQIPFSSWLPAAMAAPTPVSSLVHSSTLVTAGIYILIRFHYLIFKNDLLLFYILIRGLLTIILSGLSANFEYDLKKIIAYSTLSQLGLIVMIIGIKNFELAFFHLIIHAIFKSIIFICSGVIIHSYSNNQDIRFIGLAANFIPFTTMVFFISRLSLCGIPFFSGFYSKDQILEILIINNLNFIIYLIIIIRTGLTISYSIRLIYYLFNGPIRFLPIINLKDFKVMNFSILILFIITLNLGYLLNLLIFSIIDEIYLLKIEKILILLITILFIFLRLYINLLFKFLNINFLIYFSGKIWFLYDLNKLIVLNFLKIRFFLIKIIDKGYLEWFFKKLIVNYSKKLNFNFMNFYNSYLVSILILIGIFIILIILI